MKRRGLSANAWILIVVGLLVVLVAVDVGRRMVAGPAKPRRMTEAAAPAAPAYDPQFQPGDRAPDFELPDSQGKKHRLSQLVQDDTLLFFACGCAQCLDLQSYLGILRGKMRERAPRVVSVSSMPKDRERTWFRDTGLEQKVLYERNDGPTFQAYRGHPCPRVFGLKKDLTVAWYTPSPKDVPQLRELGNMLAQNLGFPPGAE